VLRTVARLRPGRAAAAGLARGLGVVHSEAGVARRRFYRPSARLRAHNNTANYLNTKDTKTTKEHKEQRIFHADRSSDLSQQSKLMRYFNFLRPAAPRSEILFVVFVVGACPRAQRRVFEQFG
jgi:hypothetical protein